MGLSAVLGVWAGFALESGGQTPITGDALTPYVDDILNELEVRPRFHSYQPFRISDICLVYPRRFKYSLRGIKSL